MAGGCACCSTSARSSRRVADRHPDRGGDRADLRRRAAPLRHRRLDRLSPNGLAAHGVPVLPAFLTAHLFAGSPRSTCPGRRNSASTCSSGWRSSAPPMACAPASMSASTCWSTCCRRRSRKRVIVFGLLCGALFTGIVAVVRRRLRLADVRTPASSRTISKCRCGSSIWRSRSAPA